MKKIIETEVVTFDELTPEQQNKVLDNLRDINTHPDWHEDQIYSYKKLLGYMGFEGVTISFSGFSSQGDGASFNATHYSYAPGAAEKIKAEAPTDEVFAQCANEIQEIQRRYFYGITGKVFRTSHQYSHENTVTSELFNKHDVWLHDKDDDLFNAAIHKVMRYIYRQLEEEYEYQTSDEAVKETIEANEYFFNPSTCKVAQP